MDSLSHLLNLPGERQTSAYFAVEVSSGPGWLRNFPRLTQQVSDSSVPSYLCLIVAPALASLPLCVLIFTLISYSLLLLV